MMYCNDPTQGYKARPDSGVLYLVLGDPRNKVAGLGNELVAFPGLLFFAMFTNREILIAHGSKFEQLCRTIKCGFPFYSDMLELYPETFPDLSMVKQFHEREILEKFIKTDDPKRNQSAEVLALPVLMGTGSKHVSEWVAKYPPLVQCLSNITHCVLGDIACYDRFAYQSLIKGGFDNNTDLAYFRKHIVNFPHKLLKGILNLPHRFAPHLDGAIHIRTEFNSFEDESKTAAAAEKEILLVDGGKKNSSPSTTAVEAASLSANISEVTSWLNSPAKLFVYESMVHRLHSSIVERDEALHKHENKKNLLVMQQQRGSQSPFVTNHSSDSNNFTDTLPLYVYLSGDNEEVKNDFIHWLHNEKPQENHPASTGSDSGGIGGGRSDEITTDYNTVYFPHSDTFRRIVILHFSTKFIHHMKDLSFFLHPVDTAAAAAARTDVDVVPIPLDDGVFNIVFDWYCMSLARTIVTWRRGHSMFFPSTFAHSAQRVSGTRERTTLIANKVVVGSGLGSVGYKLSTNKARGGGPMFEALQADCKC